jgi:hypothetical protein
MRVLVLMMATSALTIAGCESLRQAIRSASQDKDSRAVKATSGAMAVDSDTSKIQAVDSDAKNPKPFFQNNRRFGGWSREANEIESHLGVGN